MSFSISCIIVCYNNAPYIGRAIESVLTQSRVPDEILIADDCSTDNSRNVIEKYAKMDKRIKPVYRPKNLGVAKNRDLAIKESSGTFFTILDGDDWYYSDKVRLEAKVLQKNPEAIACSDFALTVENEKKVDIISPEQFCTLNTKRQMEFVVRRKRGIPCYMMMSKSKHIEIGGTNFNLKRYEDWDLKLRLIFARSKWIATKYTGFAYQRIGNGLSHANQFVHLRDKIKVLTLNYGRAPWKYSYLKSVGILFTGKGFKYISGKRNPYGFTE